MTALQSIHFDSTRQGKHLVVFGGVHGNEHCGALAIRALSENIASGALQLKQGRITVVPICNPQAYARNVRFIDRNLNRHFYPKDQHVHYEDSLDGPLCALLDEADLFLDLHSYQSQGGPFAFLGTSSQAEVDYARALGVPAYIHGWADAFGKAETHEQRKASIGTTDYARNNAQKALAVTLECGHHHNDDNVANAMHGMLRIMAYADMIAPQLPPVDVSAQQCVQMKQVFYKDKPGNLVKRWHHLDMVQAGEVIAKYDDGTALKAPESGVLVLPKTQTDHALGSEWFYFGVPCDFPHVGEL